MISKDKDNKLVRIYFYICDKFEELQFYCERFSNKNEPEFTDQEIMTIYLYNMPIITCSGKRSGKVAREITDKGFCSTKWIYYSYYSS